MNNVDYYNYMAVELAENLFLNSGVTPDQTTIDYLEKYLLKTILKSDEKSKELFTYLEKKLPIKKRTVSYSSTNDPT